MTNNFLVIREYMKSLDIPEKKEHIDDKVFEIQLLRRGKDNPDMPAANYDFKNYYIDSLEMYDRYTDEIIKCCDMFRLRAYVSINVKSKKKLQLECLRIIGNNLCMGELKKPWRIFYRAFGSTKANDQRWIVDVDSKDLVYNNEIVKIIKNCKCKYENPIITLIETKDGFHIITYPFNVKEFTDMFAEKYPDIKGDDIPQIKKNHLTLLYENI